MRCLSAAVIATVVVVVLLEPRHYHHFHFRDFEREELIEIAVEDVAVVKVEKKVVLTADPEGVGTPWWAFRAPIPSRPSRP